ncbi:MAG: hypothetical protein JW888_08755, partial [Pirellulales bacterium]|nr:hypothetical protein [Pirellulales bacterium]
MTYYSYHPDNGRLACKIVDVDTGTLPDEVDDTGTIAGRWVVWSDTVPFTRPSSPFPAAMN